VAKPAFVLIVLLAVTARAEGQTNPTPIVGAGVMISAESGRDDPPYLSGPLSGAAPAWDVMAGATVSPRTAIVFEVNDARNYKVQQAARAPGGSDRYERTHHDTMYSLTLHFRAAERFKVVGGFALAHIHTDETRFRYFDLIGSGPPRMAEGPFISNRNDLTGGAVVGFDYAAFQRNERRLQRNVIGVGPTARVFIINHGDSPPRLGYGAYLVRFGLHVIARF
jgi:hypothetical protein